LTQVKTLQASVVKISRMQYPTIPIRPLPVLAATAPPPSLQGDALRVEQVLTALRQVVESEIGADVPAGVWLRSLRLVEGEVEVALAPELRGCGRAIAQGAFDALRRLLPDTDIYVGSPAR
jgi:hypothetical protein